MGRIVFSTPWFRIEEKPAPAHWAEGGEARPFYRIVNPDAVIVLPRLDDGRILMVRQYRPARERLSLELPAGQLDPGEDPAAAARRELLEETGHEAGTLEYLGVAGSSLDRETARLHLFLARDVRPCPGAAAEPGVEVVALTLAELRAEVAAGRCEHLAGLGVLLLAQWHEQEM